MNHNSDIQTYKQMKEIAGAIHNDSKLSDAAITAAQIVKSDLAKVSLDNFMGKPQDKIVAIQKLKLDFSKLESLLQKTPGYLLKK